MFKKNHKKIGGRKAGKLNKKTELLKELNLTNVYKLGNYILNNLVELSGDHNKMIKLCALRELSKLILIPNSININNYIDLYNEDKETSIMNKIKERMESEEKERLKETIEQMFERV